MVRDGRDSACVRAAWACQVFAAGDYLVAQFRADDAPVGDDGVKRPTVFTVQGYGGVLTALHPGDRAEVSGGPREIPMF